MGRNFFFLYDDASLQVKETARVLKENGQAFVLVTSSSWDNVYTRFHHVKSQNIVLVKDEDKGEYTNRVIKLTASGGNLLRQVLQLTQIEETRWLQLVMTDHDGGVDAMVAMGATLDEVLKVAMRTLFYRRVDAKLLNEALNNITASEENNFVYTLELKSARCKLMADYFFRYMQLVGSVHPWILFSYQDEPGMVFFRGSKKVILELRKHFGGVNREDVWCGECTIDEAAAVVLHC